MANEIVRGVVEPGENLPQGTSLEDVLKQTFGLEYTPEIEAEAEESKQRMTDNQRQAYLASRNIGPIAAANA